MKVAKNEKNRGGNTVPRLNMVAAIGAPSVVKRVLISRIATGKPIAKWISPTQHIILMCFPHDMENFVSRIVRAFPNLYARVYVVWKL